MFETLSKKQLKLIAVIFAVLSFICIILVVVIPIVLKNENESNFSSKTSPKIDNTNLWAKFPGDLKTSLINKYSVLDYASGLTQPKVKDSFSIEEEINYSNFVSSGKDQISFDAKRTYKFSGENEQKSIKSVSMGMFEALESLTNPPYYKTLINSIHYLQKKALIDPDAFIRQLYTLKTFDDISADPKLLHDVILVGISDEKYEKIISQEETYKKYSMSNVQGLYQWMKIFGIKEKISEASWLKKLFELTDEEIDSILGSKNYLYLTYEQFNKDLSAKFKCEYELKCGKELLYQQLIDGSVVETLQPKIKDMKTLYQTVDADFYPFDKTPEMKYYEHEKAKTGLPSLTQLDNLLNTESKKCLLFLNNVVSFLYFARTENFEKAKEEFDISSDNLIFLNDYFYNYLPSIFIYPEITLTNSNKVTIEPVAKAYATVVQNTAANIYNSFSQIGGLYDYIVANIVMGKLKEKFVWEEQDELCSLIFQQILDDGRKVLKICSDPMLSFGSEKDIGKWFGAYSCFTPDETGNKCDMTVINYLKKIIYISEEEIEKIYSEDFLGGPLAYAMEQVNSAYKCGDNCNDDYFMKVQFIDGRITSNAPKPLVQTETIHNWFPEIFPNPIEISYYQKKLNHSENFEEKDIDYFLSLMPRGGEDILDMESSYAFKQKLNFEIEYTKYLNKNEEKSSLVKLFDFLNEAFVFKEEILVNYENKADLLQGNNKEDLNWINYLKSGNYFDGYKPALEKTTGFNFGVDLETKKQTEMHFDNLAILASDENNNLRKIININNLTTLNLFKEEYDYVQNKKSEIFSPLFNFKKLSEKSVISDGFQYDKDLEEIYYYDPVSSRPYKFIYKETVDFTDEIECKKYILDKLGSEFNEEFDTNSNKAFITQKVNKPYVVSDDFKLIGVKDKKDNYICVDPMSNMVLDSHINLIYGVYSRNYGYINGKIDNEKIYPVFTYERQYKVDSESYEKQFPGVSDYHTFKIVFIIIGIILIVLFAFIAVFCILLLKKRSEGKDSTNISLKENILPEGSAVGINKSTTRELDDK